jgi:hypothetical protein
MPLLKRKNIEQLTEFRMQQLRIDEKISLS